MAKPESGAANATDHAAAKALVQCKEVTKDFAGGQSVVRALRGINLSIRSGELTLLVGPSGCGKTTLLSVIAGILTPTAGTVETLGQQLNTLSAAQRAKLRLKSIGFVFQQFNLVPTLSVAENVALPLLIAGVARSIALASATRELESVGLGHYGKESPTRLSGGEQQRVAFARALVHQPRLVVCDEPTSALDAATGHKVMQTLRETAVRPDRAVVVVTHDPRVYAFADRIVSIEDGVVINDETQSLSNG
jgi:putative ABC transport system ATP-binding protein